MDERSEYNHTRVERVLSAAKRCRFRQRCLLRWYANDATPTVFSDDLVHCLAYHNIFDVPGGTAEYYEGLAHVYSNTEHVACALDNEL